MGGDQFVQGGGAEDDLLTVGGAEPGVPGLGRRRGGSRRYVAIGRHREERRLIRPGRIAIVRRVHVDMLAARS